MAVGDSTRHPEYAGNVASVDIRDFWREIDESPANQDYHYNRNAETYLLVGDALGRAMAGLQGGKAEPLPQRPRPRRVAGTQAAELAAKVGAFALTDGSKDSVILASLSPGAYTIQVSGADGTTGVALIEVYELP